MTSEERKKEIIRLLLESEEPITGEYLAKRLQVTRQIIVKDIALIRAEKNKIIATSRGYLWEKEKEYTVKRTVSVCHTAEKIEEELQLIVDLGGRVLTTAVQHPVYGALGEALNIRSRKDIKLFLARIKETGCEPLLALTKGKHQHTLEADSEEDMDEIINMLAQKGYLISCV